MILTHKEYFNTALIIDFWFSIPMALIYFAELLLCKKATKAIYIIIALKDEQSIDKNIKTLDIPKEKLK